MRFSGAAWQQVPLGPNAAHHIGLIELERSSELPFKTPSLRNMFDKFGMDLTRTNSRSGFGFLHDGSVDTLVRFVQDAFDVNNDQSIADLTAFLLTFTGSDLTPGSLTDPNRSPGVASLDTPAAAGRQLTISNSLTVPLIDSMIGLATSSTGRVDLVVKGFKDGLPRGWFFDRTSGNFLSDRQSETFTPTALRALAASGSEQTYTVVPRGAGKRIGIDRDADGYLDRDELDFGSDPANPLSRATNTPPHLLAVASQTVLKGKPVNLLFSATDDDIPAQQLTFSLDAGSPPDAAINPTNGAFTWVPAGPPGANTNLISVIVTDNGNPNRSTTNTLVIIATDLNVNGLSVSTNGALITWSAIPGVTYRVQYKDDLSDPVWIDLPGDVLATTNVAARSDLGSLTNKARFYRVIAP
jgi:hypothetical protein